MRGMSKRALLLAGPLVVMFSTGAAAAEVVSTVWVLARTSLSAEQVREINERSRYGSDLVSTAPEPVSPAEDEKEGRQGGAKAPVQKPNEPERAPSLTEPMSDAPQALDGRPDVPADDEPSALR